MLARVALTVRATIIMVPFVNGGNGASLLISLCGEKGNAMKTKKCPNCDCVQEECANDKVGIEFIKDFCGLSREEIREMSSDYCQDHGFFPMPAVKGASEDEDLWSVVELIGWEEGRLDYAIERARELFHGVMCELEVIRQGRIALLEKHFGIDLKVFKYGPDEDFELSDAQVESVKSLLAPPEQRGYSR